MSYSFFPCMLDKEFLKKYIIFIIVETTITPNANMAAELKAVKAMDHVVSGVP